MNPNPPPENPPVDHGEVVQRPGLRIAWAWLFPVLAAAATAWLFWSNWKANGPEIEITFESAPGIQAGKTPLIYRGVTAGEVTAVRLDSNLDRVVVVVRLKAFAADLAKAGTTFWIDQPVVGLAETTGLDALIQGNSLQARMGAGPPVRKFTGVDHVPLTPLESPALTIKLRADSLPFLDRGSPVFYRGISVGAVEDKALDDLGNPYLRVVIDHKFAGTVRENSRFWPVPATSLKVGPDGVQIDLLGLKAILLGGLEFDVFGTPGEPATDEREFVLSADRMAARATGRPVQITFRNGLGLQAGQTEVRHLGIPVGYVESVHLNAGTQSVETVVRFQPKFEHLHTAGTVFTLIRPQLSLEGVSGLETLVTGVYIDCVPGPEGESITEFAGRTHGPDGWMTVQSDDDTLPLILSAPTLPALGEGAPVFYRGLVAGHVTDSGLDADGQPVLHVRIRSEFAPVVRENTRFWAVPATSIEAGPGVLKLDLAGLQTLVQGALAFDVFGQPAAASKPESRFTVFPTKDAARAVSPPIRIRFDNGQGLLAGRTQVRHLGVPVGLVESVQSQNGRVEAVVRLNEGTEALRREGSVYSVVRLKVSLDGVEGLETALSGVYIECVPAETGRLTDHFTGVGMEKVAFAEEEERGFEVVVTTPRTTIVEGAPVSYRGLVVGKVGRKTLSDDGRSLELAVVVNPPYDRLLRENTKFWDAGGMQVSIGFLAVKIQSTSLEALARGGLAFATPDDLGPRVPRGHRYSLHRDSRREWLRWAPAVPGVD